MMNRSHFKNWEPVDVRWGDMDMMGHVNNAKYFTYLESARIAFFRETGFFDALKSSENISLVSAGCDFKQEVRYPATLEIGTLITHISNRSIQMQHGFFFKDTDTLAAKAHSVVVAVDLAVGKSVPLRDELRELLAPYLQNTGS